MSNVGWHTDLSLSEAGQQTEDAGEPITDMRPQNSLGESVDPVPFLVVAAGGFLGCYSFGPAYLMEFGISLSSALALTTVAFVATTAAAYHRFVWAARPSLRSEIPAGLRIRRLLLGSLAIAGVFALLSLPLLSGG